MRYTSIWKLGLLASLLLLLGLVGVAHADPISQATGSIGTATDLLKLYGPIWGGMLIVYGLASAALAEAQTKHWLTQGRALAALVAGLGIFAAILQTHFNGGQWDGVIVTAILSVFKLTKPTITPAPAKSSQGGFVGRRMMTGLAIFALAGGAVVVVSCAWTKNEAKVVETAAIDCTKGEAAKAVQLFSPMLDQLLVLATGGDGHLDKSQAEAATKTLAGDIGGCVAATSFAKILAPAPAGSGAPQSSPLITDPGDARALFEQLRASRFGGARYVTTAGPL